MIETFDGTCAFTRTAIKKGEEALLVVMQPKERDRWCTQSLYATCFESLSSQKDPPFKYIGLGKYNGRWAIEGFDERLWINLQPITLAYQWWENQFTVHKGVAESLLEHPFGTDSVEADVIRLVRKAYVARIPLFNSEPLGEQFQSNEELSLQREILRLTGEVLDRHQAER